MSTSTYSACPPVSVLMSVYNGARFLDEAVDSIRSQTFRDFEFLIIDDGSSDGTPAILARHAEADARIRIVTQENRGLIASLNRGFAEARGEFIARMDADDVSRPYRLAAQMEFLRSRRDIVLVGGAIEVIDDQGRSSRTIQLPEKPDEIRRHMRGLGCAVAHPTVVCRRQAVLDAGGLRSAYRHAEDYDLWLRMIEKHDFANLPEVVLSYRRSEGSVSIRHAAQQVLGAFCARVAARRRLEGAPDPTSNVAMITPEVVLGLGVDQDTLNAEMLRGLYEAADMAIDEGRRSAAAEFLAAARPYAPAAGLRSAALDLNRKAATVPASIAEQTRHRRLLLEADPNIYREVFGVPRLAATSRGGCASVTPKQTPPMQNENICRPVAHPCERCAPIVADLERELERYRNGLATATYFTKFPPASLAWRVGGADSSGNVYPDFLISGFQVVHNMLAILTRHGKKPAEFRRLLDFGCGCGRVIRFLAYERFTAQIIGCDIDPEAIAWCRENIDVAEFLVSPLTSPLPFPDGHLDFVYSISIFTHLSPSDQFFWLEELRRVTVPGAILILTTQGRNRNWEELPQTVKDQLEREGIWYDQNNIYFEDSKTFGYKFPETLKLTYHTHDYIRRHWSRYFTLLEICEKAISYNQDAIVLKRE